MTVATTNQSASSHNRRPRDAGSLGPCLPARTRDSIARQARGGRGPPGQHRGQLRGHDLRLGHGGGAAGVRTAAGEVAGAGEPLGVGQHAERVGRRELPELVAGHVVFPDHPSSSLSSVASFAIASFTRILTVPSGLPVFCAISLWDRPSK